MPDLTPGQKLIAANKAGEFSHSSDLAKAIDEAIAGEREVLLRDINRAAIDQRYGDRVIFYYDVLNFLEEYTEEMDRKARSPSPAPVKQGADNDG
jgi:hypothetical protein